MRRRLIILILFSLGAATHLFGTTSQGGKGLMYVQSARLLPVGYFEFYSGMRYFGKVANFGSKSKAYTLWTVQGFTSFNFAASSHIELAVSPILYQDINRGGGNVFHGFANFPDDVLISFKLGSFGSLESPYLFGGSIYTRIPTAKQHNVIYEPYTAGKVEVGLTGLASYFSNTTFPDDGWSLHANLGYLNHNDAGKDLTSDPNDPTPVSMSSEILFGLGALYPTGTFDFSFEFNARHFLTRPPATAYSREYMSYLTTGIYYKPYRWITFEMGMDLRLFSGEDISQYYPNTNLTPPPTKDFPNYPSWRGILGIKLAILPFSLYTSDESSIKDTARNRRDILEKMLQEQQSTEGAEQELSRIRSERKKVEEELERLRKLLETEKKKEKKNNQE